MDRYVAHNENVARQIAAQGVAPDVWVLHDPQTLPLAALLPPDARIIWVCHIDTTLPNRPVIEQLVPFMRQAHRVVVSLPHYAVPDLDPAAVRVIPPAIDPLASQEHAAPRCGRAAHAGRYGSGHRASPDGAGVAVRLLEGPLGVIDAYREAKESVPDVQLALLGVIEAKDDPEAFDVLETVRAHAGGDPDVHLYSDPAEAGALEVGAVQQGADVVIQKSLREGFGLTVTEAMWKGSPVIGGNCGGIRTQIADGRTGYLVDSPSECARRAVELLRDPEKTRRMGRTAAGVGSREVSSRRGCWPTTCRWSASWPRGRRPARTSPSRADARGRRLVGSALSPLSPYRVRGRLYPSPSRGKGHWLTPILTFPHQGGRDFGMVRPLAGAGALC